MGSRRLPGKSLADVAGRSLIQRVVDRARMARRVDEVVVLTSTEPADDPLVAHLEKASVPVRRGPLEDVARRFRALYEESEPDYLVRVTGDCPLVSGPWIDRQIDALARYGADLVQVRGQGVGGTLGGQTVLSARALLAALDSPDPRDREHVGAFWLATNTPLLRVVELEVDPRLQREDVRWHVDEAPDLEQQRRIHAQFAPGVPCHARLVDLLEWLDENPDVHDLNAGVRESAATGEAQRLFRAGRVVPVARLPIHEPWSPPAHAASRTGGRAGAAP